MEALYLGCGARRPQLKRDPLGGATMVYLTVHLAFSMLVGQYGTSFNSQRQTPTDTAAVLYSLGRSLRDEFRSPISIQ